MIGRAIAHSEIVGLLGLIEVVVAAGGVSHPRTALAQPVTGSEPAWVVVREVPAYPVDAAPSGASYLLLYDSQRDLESKTAYFHLAIKLLAYDGVQELSDIHLDYDPAFQTLTLHRVRLHRDGKSIDKLGKDPIKTLQREPNLERHVYDGTLTATIQLSDVRVGDILEYSYSRSGLQPAWQGHDFGGFSVNLPVPVEMFSYRLRAPERASLTFRNVKTDIQPHRTRADGIIDHKWTLRRVEAVTWDNNVPVWYLTAGMVLFSDYRDWREMAAWARSLFEVTSSERARLRNLAGELLTSGDKPSAIQSIVRFVQDEIRYLSLAEGLSAYLPHPPTQVWTQRYGDCKDKALLLCTLLNELAVDAHPVLVNTAAPPSEELFAIAPGDFNHCVVAFRYDGRTHFVDPTMSYQGGDLAHRYFPNYGLGLIVAADTEGLTRLPVAEIGMTAVTERFEIDDADGANLTVTTEYAGLGADLMRYSFATENPTAMRRRYESYYAASFPEIKMTRDVSFTDDRKDAENVIVVKEFYHIDHIWKHSREDTSSQYVDFIPEGLKNTTLWNSGANRTMPFAVGPAHYRHEFIIEADDIERSPPESVKIEGKGFEYRRRVSVEGGAAHIVHEYRRAEQDLEAAEVADFIAEHKRIRDRLTYRFTSGPAGDEVAFRTNWPLVWITLTCFLGALWAALWVHRNYDPEPRRRFTPAGAAPLKVGGWLLLPALGLVVNPVQWIADLPTLAACFYADMATEFGMDFGIILGIVAVTNAVGIVLWGLVTWLFFKRRTSAVTLYVLHISFWFVSALIDTTVLLPLLPDSLEPSGPDSGAGDLTRAVISCAVWIPYFLRSDRVRRTFVMRGPLHRPAPEGSVVPVAAAVDVPAGVTYAPAELEQVAAARMRAGVPVTEVAAWLTTQGLSPAMAQTVVEILKAEGSAAANPGDNASGTTMESDRGRHTAITGPGKRPRWTRLLPFAIIILIIFVLLARR